MADVFGDVADDVTCDVGDHAAGSAAVDPQYEDLVNSSTAKTTTTTATLTTTTTIKACIPYIV